MGDGTILRQFDDIDDKVEQLIEFCSSLKDENSTLKSRVVVLEQEILNKTEIEKRTDRDKEVVKEKIDSLLSKLKNFSEITT